MVNSSGPQGAGKDSGAGFEQQLSLLMDGELEPSSVAAAVAVWRDDAQARASWHAYHLVGDVLRSDELALRPARDRAFMTALRARLEAEPVPLATTPLQARPAMAQPLAVQVVVAPPRPGLRQRLLAPMAVAAGFVAVAGVLVVFRIGQTGAGDTPRMAAASSSSGVVAVSGLNIVRDARLDRYLSAHRKLANGFDAPGAAGQQVQIVYEAR